MTFLGYALFTGTYGTFTVPVFEDSEYYFPSGLETSRLAIPFSLFNSIHWNYSRDIFGLVTDPPIYSSGNVPKESPFECDASPSVEISVCWDALLADNPDDYFPRIDTWVGGSRAESLGFENDKDKSVIAIFKLRLEGNKYFINGSSRDLVRGFWFSDDDRPSAIDTLTIQSTPVLIREQLIDSIQIDPPTYSLTFGQSNVYNIRGYKDGELVEGIEFEVGPLPEEARGVTLTYPFNDDYTKCEIKMPYITDGVAPDDFEVQVRYADVVSTFEVNFYGHGNAYTPGGDIGGGSGISSALGGGGGTFPSSPGPSLVDQIPTGQTGNDLANSGLFTMYLMNQQYMNLIGNIMWEDNLGIQALKAVFGQPIDAIISTMSYPFDLTNFVSKIAQNLYFGPWNSGLPFQALTKSSFQINWGTINIPFGWGNFLDYAPYTKMELFLPWGPGYVPIDPNDVSPFSNTPGNFNVSTFTNGSIQVKTNIELGKGTCVHNVIGNNGRVIGSYSGVVGKQVPMTALDTGGKIITTIGAVAAMTSGAVTAAGAMAGKFNTGQVASHKRVDPLLNSPLFADTGYMQKASEGVSTVNRGANMAASALLSNPISFPRAGTFSDGSSALTVQYPFLLVSRPVQSVPAQYGHYNGYPSNIHYANLSGLSGYTEISEIHLDNVTATADELAELDAVLKGGILL